MGPRLRGDDAEERFCTDAEEGRGVYTDERRDADGAKQNRKPSLPAHASGSCA